MLTAKTDPIFVLAFGEIRPAHFVSVHVYKAKKKKRGSKPIVRQKPHRTVFLRCAERNSDGKGAPAQH